jgi:uncharacterized membrane protein YhhN
MTGTVGLLVALSLVLGLGYPLMWGVPPGPEAMIAVKGAGVGLLALAAALRARTADGWLLASVMALGALGDVLLEIDFAAGASAFAAGHIVAIILYLRNRRAAAGPLDRAIAAFLPAAAAVLPVLLLRGRPEGTAFAIYGALAGAMAAAAWTSRFPRWFVALGALMFLASDMLIAVRLGMEALWLSLPIWLLYYAGQVMIFAGVISSLPAKPAGRGTRRSLMEGN